MYDAAALQRLIAENALKFGDFTLASGRKSKFYLDCRQVTLDSGGAALIAEAMLDLLSADMPALVGGMAIGADPITAAIITLAGQRNIPLRGVMVRKEAKQHGTGKFVEGPYHAGETIAIVEDSVTTGGSSLLAIERCEAVGLKVTRVLAIVDRLEGGREAFASRGYELTSFVYGSRFRHQSLKTIKELKMADSWNGDPIHPILPRAHEFDIIRFDYNCDPNNFQNDYLDITFKRGDETRHLRFLKPRSLKLEEGFPRATRGMIILDIRHRGWDQVGVEVADFEASHGSVTFFAAEVSDQTEQPDLALLSRI